MLYRAAVLAVITSLPALEGAARCRAPQIRGLVVRNYCQAREATLPAPAQVFPFRQVIDPVLVERCGLRAHVFRYWKRVLAPGEWDHFRRWYGGYRRRLAGRNELGTAEIHRRFPELYRKQGTTRDRLLQGEQPPQLVPSDGRPHVVRFPSGAKTAQVGTVVAKGSRLTIRVEGLARQGTIQLGRLRPTRARQLSHDVDRSGELSLRITRAGGQTPATVTIRCAGPSCRQKPTRYPVVFLHGMAGRRKYFGIVSYWHGLRDRAARRGLDAHFTQTRAIAHTVDRVGSLYRQITKILDATGARKVHLVGHSQGGLDGRALISGLGLADRVASLTTLGTPHGGTGIKFGTPFITRMNFRSAYMKNRFEKRFPLHPAIPVFSYAGRASGPWSDAAPPRQGSLNPIFWPFAWGLKRENSPLGHDGLVPVHAAFRGYQMGVALADHLALIWGSDDFDQHSQTFSHLKLLRRLERQSEARG